jgi:protein disulfide-isomerase
MKNYIFIALVLTFSNAALSQSKPDSLVWLTDVNQAHAISTVTGKPIFAFFTGSDWCGWCHKLQAEVFAKPEFKAWANDQVVLLELDFPARKVLPDQLIQQNQSLKTFFKITGFPTIWMFCISEDKTAAEKRYMISPYGSLGYPKNPVKGQEEVAFLENAKSILASRSCPIVP